MKLQDCTVGKIVTVASIPDNLSRWIINDYRAICWKRLTIIGHHSDPNDRPVVVKSHDDKVFYLNPENLIE